MAGCRAALLSIPKEGQIEEVAAPEKNASYLDWALWYAAKGIPVFPLRPKSKIPFKSSHGVDDATTDAKQIRKWWTRSPGANIGAACGVKFDVLDIDQGGTETFLKHDKKERILVATKTVKGGTHIFYDPSLVPLSNGVKRLPGLDVRTKGGYVLLPPSFVDDGEVEGHYEWREGKMLNGQALPPFPDWAARAFRQNAREDNARVSLDSIFHGDLEDGKKHEQLRDAIFKMCKSGIDVEIAKTLVETCVAKVDPSRFKDGKERTLAKYLKEVEDCYRKHEANTYELPPRGTQRRPSGEIQAPTRRLRKASEIQAKLVDWMLFPYFPKGMLVGMEGDPGLGKTFVLLSIAAALSQGRRLPYIDADVQPGTTLFFTLDDSAEYTLKPRLERMDADLDRIYLDDDQLILNHEGLIQLREMIIEQQASWVVLDPLAKFIDPVIRSPRPELSLSEIMTELKKISEDTHCTITPNRHLKKGRDDNPIYAGYGGIEIIGGYRSALRIDKDPDRMPTQGSKFGIVSHIKNNVGPIGDSFGYEIRPIDRTVAEILFTGLSEFRPENAPSQKPADNFEIKDARAFLLHELSTGRAELATVLTAQAQKQGITPKTLRTAREALCGAPERIGFGKDAKVFWRLKAQYIQEDPYA